MKKIVISFLLLCLTLSFYGQSKKELKYQVYKLEKEAVVNQDLKNENQELKTENERLKEENQQLKMELSRKSPSNTNNSAEQRTDKQSQVNSEVKSGQCKATTASGTQCKRYASEDSDFCWQHQGNSYSKSTSQPSKSSGSSGSGRSIQTGPRGGKYYINKNGNKTYIKH